MSDFLLNFLHHIMSPLPPSSKFPHTIFTTHCIVGIIRRGLIFTVFMVNKHPQKLNQ